MQPRAAKSSRAGSRVGARIELRGPGRGATRQPARSAKDVSFYQRGWVKAHTKQPAPAATIIVMAISSMSASVFWMSTTQNRHLEQSAPSTCG
jgi:hypothetical protein